MSDNRFIPGVTDAGKPRAAKGEFPYPGHGSLKEARVREAMTRGSDRLRETILTVQWCSNLGRKAG